jgi:hypothetical protein
VATCVSVSRRTPVALDGEACQVRSRPAGAATCGHSTRRTAPETWAAMVPRSAARRRTDPVHACSHTRGAVLVAAVREAPYGPEAAAAETGSRVCEGQETRREGGARLSGDSDARL